MPDYAHLDSLKKKLDALRPLPEAALRNLHEDLILRWTYNSNAIEGNTLTLMETKVALEGITVGGKTLREHFEAINHREAILFVEEIVRRSEPFSLWQLRQIHGLILKNIDDANAGAWRRINVTIAGAEHEPPDFLHVPEQMERLAEWRREHESLLHPVELAARLHVDLVKIHPFVDGNGRTARLVMNLELMKAGFPAVVLPVSQRLAYYEALDAAHTRRDYGPFLEMIAELVRQGFKPYWHALGLRVDQDG